MAAIAAAVGTAVISGMAESLTSFAVDKAVEVAKSLSHDDLVKELTSLKVTLNLIEDLLNDAESKQTKSKGVRLWLEELKDAAYDAEDVLDEYVTDTAILQQSKEPLEYINGKMPSDGDMMAPAGCGVKDMIIAHPDAHPKVHVHYSKCYNSRDRLPSSLE